jgi:hypothetical protein
VRESDEFLPPKNEVGKNLNSSRIRDVVQSLGSKKAPVGSSEHAALVQPGSIRLVYALNVILEPVGKEVGQFKA